MKASGPGSSRVLQKIVTISVDENKKTSRSRRKGAPQNMKKKRKTETEETKPPGFRLRSKTQACYAAGGRGRGPQE